LFQHQGINIIIIIIINTTSSTSCQQEVQKPQPSKRCSHQQPIAGLSGLVLNLRGLKR
jgi:dihydroorotate dehydrogenase